MLHQLVSFEHFAINKLRCCSFWHQNSTVEDRESFIFHFFQNPEEDFDWDPDVFAIYRRNVHFIVPEQNELMLKLMDKLKGEAGTLEKDRLYYAVRFPIHLVAISSKVSERSKMTSNLTSKNLTYVSGEDCEHETNDLEHGILE